MPKTDKTMLSDAALEAFFEAGRAHPPEPGAQLMARIVADADAETAARTPARAPASRATARPAKRWSRAGIWDGFASAIGGWPALASLATAAVAGVWLGFASPDRLDALAGGLLLPGTGASEATYELEDLLPGYSGFEGLTEEVQG